MLKALQPQWALPSEPCVLRGERGAPRFRIESDCLLAVLFGAGVGVRQVRSRVMARLEQRFVRRERGRVLAGFEMSFNCSAPARAMPSFLSGSPSLHHSVKGKVTDPRVAHVPHMHCPQHAAMGDLWSDGDHDWAG
jgi:hypothetical protein